MQWSRLGVFLTALPPGCSLFPECVCSDAPVPSTTPSLHHAFPATTDSAPLEVYHTESTPLCCFCQRIHSNKREMWTRSSFKCSVLCTGTVLSRGMSGNQRKLFHQLVMQMWKTFTDSLKMRGLLPQLTAPGYTAVHPLSHPGTTRALCSQSAGP